MRLGPSRSRVEFVRASVYSFALVCGRPAGQIPTIFHSMAQPFSVALAVAEPAIGIFGSPAGVAGTELPQMAVGPAHRGLHHGVQPVELDADRHHDPAHDTGLNVIERDLEADEVGLDDHAASLAALWRAQAHGRSSSNALIGCSLTRPSTSRSRLAGRVAGGRRIST